MRERHAREPAKSNQGAAELAQIIGPAASDKNVRRSAKTFVVGFYAYQSGFLSEGQWVSNFAFVLGLVLKGCPWSLVGETPLSPVILP